MNTFTWKIDNYKDKNITITSETFSIEQYNFCIKVYPDGDGVGRNTHLSVFFAITKGENDDTLQWPFRAAIQMSLLNGKGEVICSDKMKTDFRSVCNRKPENGCNIASGFPKFIRLQTLESILNDDTLIIKFEILEILPPIVDLIKQSENNRKQQLLNLMKEFTVLNKRQMDVIAAINVILDKM